MLTDLKRKKIVWLGLVVGNLAIALGAFFGVRLLLEGESAALQPPPPPFPSPGAAPVCPPPEFDTNQDCVLTQEEVIATFPEDKRQKVLEDRALWEAERAKPKFEGWINGFYINPHDSIPDGVPVEVVPCLREGRGQFAPVKSTVGDIMEVAPKYLPSGYEISNSENVLCEGLFYFSNKDFLSFDRTTHLYISKQRGFNPINLQASRERLEATTLGGRPALLVKPVTKHDLSDHLIVIRTNYGFIFVSGYRISMEELVKVAEGMD